MSLTTTVLIGMGIWLLLLSWVVIRFGAMVVIAIKTIADVTNATNDNFGRAEQAITHLNNVLESLIMSNGIIAQQLGITLTQQDLKNASRN